MQAQLRRGRRRLPGMVRLHSAGGDQSIAALGKRIGHEEFELADFVSAQGQARLVVALDVDRGPAEMRREPRKRLERRRQMSQGNAGNVGKVHLQ